MADVMLALLQSNGGATGMGIFRFFAGMLIILTAYISALSFTYWISKDE